MTEQLTGYEASSVAEIEAILDAMPADADQVYLDTIGYSERAIAAVAAKRAGSGGGSTPFQIIRIPLTYQTPDLVNTTGNLAVVYQPDAGTVFDFRFYITEFFDNRSGNNITAVAYMLPRGNQGGDFATFSYDWASSNSEIENEPGLPMSPELRPIGTDAVDLADSGRHHFYASGDCDLAFSITQFSGASPLTPTQGAMTLIVITYPFSA